MEILARPKRAATELLLAQPEVADVQSFGERLHATLPGVDAAGGPAAEARLAAALRPRASRWRRARAVLPSLEDIFIARIQAADAPVEEER